MSDHQLRLFEFLAQIHRNSLEPEESKQPEWNPENCEKIAEIVVDSMSWDELRQFVFDDVYSIMLEEKDVFLANLEHYGENEDE